MVVVVLSLATLGWSLHSTSPALADVDSDGGGEGDLGVLLVDMLAYASDTLALHQDMVANESALHSRAPERRLRQAILRTPAVTLKRGALPLIEGWIIPDDDGD